MAKAAFYAGQDLSFCPKNDFDFNNCFAVVVSGASFNPCGHLLLNLGGVGGIYLHAGSGAPWVVKGRPKYMDEAGYRRYLREWQKKEIRRYRVSIKNPEAAQKKLNELMADTWAWRILPNNCVAFVEAIVEAGGAKEGMYLNCPRLEDFK